MDIKKRKRWKGINLWPNSKITLLYQITNIFATKRYHSATLDLEQKYQLCGYKSFQLLFMSHWRNSKD